ncbi:MAG: hypothetical protein PHN88_15665 [Ignavibacteria bacterium]|nr:hypothetical protein [Ignavibacteria bacterium]
MAFNSFEFLVFYPIVLVLYYIVPVKFRWMLLLICGYFFYYRGGSVIFLFLITIPDYFLARYASSKRNNRKIVFVAAVIFNLFILAFFKYALSQGGINIVMPLPEGITNHVIGAALPLGLSFIILRKICYLTDVYQKTTEAEKNFGKYALYLSYFPSVSSGPIDRYPNYRTQIESCPKFNSGDIVSGFRLILTGVFKKVFIAERLSFLVNEVYSNPQDQNGLTILMAVYFFAFQIYADFSGYTDIAIGISRTFGLELPRNFDRPYFSHSISEFWRRWHITLSAWLKDYLFMPLASYFTSGKHFFSSARYRDITAYISSALITWFLAGLWHGNELSMITWGVLQAVYLTFSLLTKKPRKKFSKAMARRRIPKKLLDFFRALFIFNLVSFTWIFFRSESLAKAFIIIRNLFCNTSFNGKYIFGVISRFDIFLSITGILSILLIDIFDFNDDQKFYSRPAWVRWTIYYAMLFITFFFGVYRSSGFMYVKF